MARTGKWFAYQHAGIKPDIITLAKGLANGFPIGACLASGAVADVFHAGQARLDFGGNPLACVAALATLAVIEDEGLAARAGKLGTSSAKASLQNSRARRASRISRKGSHDRIELDRPCGDLVERGSRCRPADQRHRDTVVRLLPPLNMKDTEVQLLIDGGGSVNRDLSGRQQGRRRRHPLTGRFMASPKHFLQFQGPRAGRARIPVRAHALVKQQFKAYQPHHRSSIARW